MLLSGDATRCYAPYRRIRCIIAAPRDAGRYTLRIDTLILRRHVFSADAADDTLRAADDGHFAAAIDFRR